MYILKKSFYSHLQMKILSTNLFLLMKSSDAFPLGIPFINSVPFCVVRGLLSLKDLSSLLKSASQSFSFEIGELTCL